MKTKKLDHPKILLIDLDDTRRDTRVRLLESRRYEVTVRNDWVASDALDHEGSFDLIILALHRKDMQAAVDYTDRVQRAKPDLPILLLTDAGVYAPRGTLSRSVEADGYGALLKNIAECLRQVRISANSKQVALLSAARVDLAAVHHRNQK